MSISDNSIRVINNITNLFMDKNLIDVIINTRDGGKIYTHKVILAAGSKYFKTMFKSYNNAKSNIAYIYMDIFDEEIVKCVILYLYGHNNITHSIVTNVLKCADYLLIDDLVNECNEYIINSIYNIPNAIYFYNKIYQLDHIYVVKRIKSVLYKDVIRTINCTYLKKINLYALIYILSDDNIIINSEDSVAIIILVWLTYNHITEEETLKLISCINIEYLSNNIKNEILSNERIKNYKLCLDYISNDHKNIIVRKPIRKNIYLLYMYDSNIHVYTYNVSNKKYSFNTTFNCIYNYASTVVDNELIIAGGDDNYKYSDYGYKKVYNDVYKLDIKTHTWIQLPSMIIPRTLFSLEVIGQTIYAIGGQGINNIEGSIECYTMGDDSWKILTEEISGIAYYSSCVYNHYIYIAGGVTKYINYNAYTDIIDEISNDIIRYDTINYNAYTDIIDEISNDIIRYDTINNKWEILYHIDNYNLNININNNNNINIINKIIYHRNYIYLFNELLSKNNAFITTRVYRHEISDTNNKWEMITDVIRDRSLLYPVAYEDDDFIIIMEYYDNFIFEDKFCIKSNTFIYNNKHITYYSLLYNVLPINKI
ncbi:kelch-like protein [Yokapox virus]|uniref:Kelch-like protein n=1 Tax=Yokapox virus TaxID=1076255 RepID=G3EI60_9POXV|nr:kelch-like protein [Yokapox virus]AEN03757.1 kelch-like protein [Yokapox virus]